MNDYNSLCLGLKGTRLTSAQDICERARAKLELSVVFVETSDAGDTASAGAPWPVRFEILDKLAIRACFDRGEPAGIGSGQHGASDWLFLPVQRNGQTVAVTGVAGPYCRRRIDPAGPAMRSLRTAFEHYLCGLEPVGKRDSPMPRSGDVTVVSPHPAEAAWVGRSMSVFFI
jgi:hypothetical protein